MLVLIVGGLTAIGLTLAFSRDSASYIAALLIYIAMGYDIVIRDMLFEYLSLVSSHLTTKEKKAREQAAKEQCIDKESDFKR